MQDKRQTTKRTYVKPTVTVLGAISKVTQAGGASNLK